MMEVFGMIFLIQKRFLCRHFMVHMNVLIIDEFDWLSWHHEE